MPTECPRCLLTNSDHALTCECGYDLTPQIRARRFLPSYQVHVPMFAKEMRKRDFIIGIICVWVVLSVSEGLWLRTPRAGRTWLQLILDSSLVGLADLGGALIIGALGWLGVWIMLAYEHNRIQLSPKRVTFGVTVLAAGLLFIAKKMGDPSVLLDYLMHAIIILGIAAFSYYAGSKGWFGRW